MLLVSTVAMLRPHQRRLIYQIGAISTTTDDENENDFDLMANKESMDTE